MLDDIFSKRQKALRGETNDTLAYDALPRPLRVQLLQIIDDIYEIIEEFYGTDSFVCHRYQYAQHIVTTLRRAYGVWELAEISTWKGEGNWDEVRKFIEFVPDIEQALDGVELFLRFGEHGFEKIIDSVSDGDSASQYRQILDKILEEVNYRFLEHGIGYQYASGRILRIDSTYIHKEITLPALQLLSSKTFRTVNEEFLTGHEHYRHQRNGDCLVHCGKAFESTMKIICDQKQWQYSSKAAAKDLLDVCYNNQLMPATYPPRFDSLRNLLASALPLFRNTAAHGAGSTPIIIPNEIARYALSLTAANIILLVEWSGIK